MNKVKIKIVSKSVAVGFDLTEALFRVQTDSHVSCKESENLILQIIFRRLESEHFLNMKSLRHQNITVSSYTVLFVGSYDSHSTGQLFQ
jgi:hypothetical protein